MRLSIDRVSVDGLLRDVSLSVDAAELVCVWSTRRASRLALLSVAAKVRRPDSGIVVTNGSVVLSQPTWPLLGGQAVVDQLMLPLLASRTSVARARSRVLGFLSDRGVEDWAAASLADLEDYQLARLSLMRALIASPDVLLVEDPAHGLEQTYGEATLDLLREARAGGAAVLVTTGSVESMRDADAVFTISQGTLRGERGEQAQVIQLRSAG